MTSICIIDSGYLKTTNTGTQLSTANRANSGSLIELKTADFKPIVKVNLDNTPTVGTYAEAEVHLVSIENLDFTLAIRLNTNSSTDMDLIYPLIQVCRTRGYKALFYNVDRTATDTSGNSTCKRDSQLVVRLANSHYDITEPQTGISFSLWTGSTTASGKNLTNVYHLMVRFSELTFSHTPDSSLLTLTLKGITTA